MGVSVYGYAGLKLKQLGGENEDLSGPGFDDDSYVYLSPSPDQWQANGLQPGIYSYRGLVEKPLGSYLYFSEFRDQLSKLIESDPDGPDTTSVFKELLVGSDTYLMMGPETLEELHDSFESAYGARIDEVLMKTDYEGFYQTYQDIRAACEEARASDWGEGCFGALLIT